MYGVPKDFCEKWFLGLCLNQLRFAAGETHMIFGDSATVLRVRGKFVVVLPNKERHELDIPDRNMSVLLDSLGSNVVSVLRKDSSGFSLLLDNGHTLEFEDDSPHYEYMEIVRQDGVRIL